MLKRSELSTANAYRQLPQVTPADFQLLWHSDYWDGPRSGLLLFRGERCWFEVFAENDEEDEPYAWRRLFAIVRLTPEQLAEEDIGTPSSAIRSSRIRTTTRKAYAAWADYVLRKSGGSSMPRMPAERR